MKVVGTEIRPLKDRHGRIVGKYTLIKLEWPSGREGVPPLYSYLIQPDEAAARWAGCSAMADRTVGGMQLRTKARRWAVAAYLDREEFYNGGGEGAFIEHDARSRDHAVRMVLAYWHHHNGVAENRWHLATAKDFERM